MTHSLRSFYAPLVSVAAVLGVLVMVTACSSSSSGGGGLSAEESAALAVFAGGSAARDSQETLPDGDTFDIGDGTSGQTGMSAMTHDGGCPHTGSFDDSDSEIRDVFGVDVTTDVITYGNYVITCPEAQAQVDGRIEVGDSGGRFYGEFGNPGADDGFFEASVQSSQTPDMSFNMAARVEVCDGCGSGTDNGGYAGYTAPEFQAAFYMDALISMDTLDGRFRFGSSTADPMELRVWAPGPDETVALDGRIGVDQSGSPCGFDWVMNTIVPVEFNNDEPWNGSVDVVDPDDPATSFNVSVNDGVISVNGQVITEERKQQIAQQCGFEDEA